MNLIKRLNRSGEGADEGVSWQLDTNRDGKVTARDALYVINRLAEDVMRAPAISADGEYRRIQTLSSFRIPNDLLPNGAGLARE